MLWKNIENADKRNVVALSNKVYFKESGVPPALPLVTCKTARLSAASEAGIDALTIGFMNFSSNSSIF